MYIWQSWRSNYLKDQIIQTYLKVQFYRGLSGFQSAVLILKIESEVFAKLILFLRKSSWHWFECCRLYVVGLRNTEGAVLIWKCSFMDDFRPSKWYIHFENWVRTVCKINFFGWKSSWRKHTHQTIISLNFILLATVANRARAINFLIGW